jgi:hypothetical protein
VNSSCRVSGSFIRTGGYEMKIIIEKVTPVIDHSVRCLCGKVYPGHKNGCPNFNHKQGCPPKAPYFEEVYDMSKPVYAIVNVFDFKAHTDKMRSLYPNWSDRQVECCLYWQPKARKQLLVGIRDFLRMGLIGYEVTICPEAMGVEITKTLSGVIDLEWPPKTITCQVALAGYKK